VPRAGYTIVGGGLIGGTKFHRIVDVPDGLGYAYNPVFHEKYASRFCAPLSAKNQSGQWSVQYEGPTPIQVINLVRSLVQTNLTAEMLDDFSAQTEQLFISPLPDGASLINFIIEMIDLLEVDLKQWKKFLAAWKVAVKRFFVRLGSELKRGRGIASYWVAWRFAIRPTISDVKRLATSIERAKKALLWLRKVNHRAVTRKNRRNLDGLFDDLTAEQSISAVDYYGTWQDNNPPLFDIPPMKTSTPVTGTIRATCEWSKVKLCATADVRFDIDDALVAEGWAATGTAWSSMQWLYNPWAITWEAIPFSWAIDWCLSEKAKLERWKQFHEVGDPYGLGVIQAACWSLKIESRFRIEFCQSGQQPQLIAIVSYRVYSRELGLPNMGSSWLRLPFSGYQCSIFAGVLDGRTRRR